MFFFFGHVHGTYTCHSLALECLQTGTEVHNEARGRTIRAMSRSFFAQIVKLSNPMALECRLFAIEDVLDCEIGTQRSQCRILDRDHRDEVGTRSGASGADAKCALWHHWATTTAAELAEILKILGRQLREAFKCPEISCL